MKSKRPLKIDGQENIEKAYEFIINLMKERSEMVKCNKCDVPLNVGLVLYNNPKNCEEHISYPYMKMHESMHFHCYIQHVIDSYLKERK